MSVFLHQCVCQFRDRACLLQSECHRVSVCISVYVSSEIVHVCFSLNVRVQKKNKTKQKKKQDGKNSGWQKVYQLRENAYLLHPLCLFMFASVCVCAELEYACISLCVRGYMFPSVCVCSEKVHICFSLSVTD